MTDTLRQLSDEGVAVWLDDLQPRAARHRQPRRPGRATSTSSASPPTRRSSRRRIADSERLRRAARATSPSRGVDVEEAVRPMTTYDVRWALRRARARSTTPPAASTAGSRSRSTRGWPTTPRRPIAEARPLWWLVDRPNLFIKIPATEEGLPAITAGARRRHQRQRHADLLARPLPRGHGRLPRPGWSRPGPTATTCSTARLGGVVLRQPGRHRGRQAAGQARHRRRPRRCAARRRSPTPASPTQAFEEVFATDRWQRAGGRRRHAAAPAVGVDRRQGPVVRRHALRHRAGRPGHGQHDAGGDAGRGRRPRRDPRRHGPRQRTPGSGDHAGAGDVGLDVDDVSSARGRGRREVRGLLERPAPTSTKAELERLAKAGGQCSVTVSTGSTGEGAGVRAGLAGRLVGKDPTLWGAEAEPEAEHRLGWLAPRRRPPEALIPQLRELHQRLTARAMN